MLKHITINYNIHNSYNFVTVKEPINKNNNSLNNICIQMQINGSKTKKDCQLR